MDKSTFIGTITSIQPRIKLTRSFDEAYHSYLGYVIQLSGELDEVPDVVFSIAIGKAAHSKHQFKVNDLISGECVAVPDPNLETAEYYKVSKLKLISSGEQGSMSLPWELVPPELEAYRERGCRRLSSKTYDSKCSSCMWGANMPVDIIVDNFNPRGRRIYRNETFCYGPLNCKLYKAGPKRRVEGRRGMVYVEEDWVDEMNVEHRSEDE